MSLFLAHLREKKSPIPDDFVDQTAPPPVEMRSWRLYPDRDFKEVILQGMNCRSRMLVNTSAIVERLAADLVKTRNGSTIRLLGPCRGDEMEKIFSQSFVEQFSNGFPEDWLLLVQQELSQLASSPNLPAFEKVLDAVMGLQLNTKKSFSPLVKLDHSEHQLPANKGKEDHTPVELGRFSRLQRLLQNVSLTTANQTRRKFESTNEKTESEPRKKRGRPKKSTITRIELSDSSSDFELEVVDAYPVSSNPVKSTRKLDVDVSSNSQGDLSKSNLVIAETPNELVKKAGKRSISSSSLGHREDSAIGSSKESEISPPVVDMNPSALAAMRFEVSETLGRLLEKPEKTEQPKEKKNRGGREPGILNRLKPTVALISRPRMPGDWFMTNVRTKLANKMKKKSPPKRRKVSGPVRKPAWLLPPAESTQTSVGEMGTEELLEMPQPHENELQSSLPSSSSNLSAPGEKGQPFEPVFTSTEEVSGASSNPTKESTHELNDLEEPDWLLSPVTLVIAESDDTAESVEMSQPLENEPRNSSPPGSSPSAKLIAPAEGAQLERSEAVLESTEENTHELNDAEEMAFEVDHTSSQPSNVQESRQIEEELPSSSLPSSPASVEEVQQFEPSEGVLSPAQAAEEVSGTSNSAEEFPAQTLPPIEPQQASTEDSADEDDVLVIAEFDTAESVEMSQTDENERQNSPPPSFSPSSSSQSAPVEEAQPFEPSEAGKKESTHELNYIVSAVNEEAEMAADFGTEESVEMAHENELHSSLPPSSSKLSTLAEEAHLFESSETILESVEEASGTSNPTEEGTHELNDVEEPAQLFIECNQVSPETSKVQENQQTIEEDEGREESAPLTNAEKLMTNPERRENKLQSLPPSSSNLSAPTEEVQLFEPGETVLASSDLGEEVSDVSNPTDEMTDKLNGFEEPTCLLPQVEPQQAPTESVISEKSEIAADFGTRKSVEMAQPCENELQSLPPQDSSPPSSNLSAPAELFEPSEAILTAAEEVGGTSNPAEERTRDLNGLEEPVCLLPQVSAESSTGEKSEMAAEFCTGKSVEIAQPRENELRSPPMPNSSPPSSSNLNDPIKEAQSFEAVLASAEEVGGTSNPTEERTRDLNGLEEPVCLLPQVSAESGIGEKGEVVADFSTGESVEMAQSHENELHSPPTPASSPSSSSKVNAPAEKVQPVEPLGEAGASNATVKELTDLEELPRPFECGQVSPEKSNVQKSQRTTGESKERSGSAPPTDAEKVATNPKAPKRNECISTEKKSGMAKNFVTPNLQKPVAKSQVPLKKVILPQVNKPEQRDSWTPEEYRAIKKGVDLFGPGKWQQIINAYPILRKRNCNDIRSAWCRLLVYPELQLGKKSSGARPGSSH